MDDGRPEDTDPRMVMEEKSQALLRVSLKDPGHLKRWLEASGRRYLVFDAVELVDSLPFPDGVDALMQVIACYRDHRRAIPTGETEKQIDPTLGKEVDVPLTKDETLDVTELDRVIRYLIRQASEKDPTWKLENLPL